MPRCFIDHLTVTAPTLEAGAEHVRRALGVAPQAGGEHPRMGTHNRLLRLGETLFLEVIAADPAAQRPARPRWFGLDALAVDAAPALAIWVARTADIDAAVRHCSEALGDVETLSRGALQWRMSVPIDGALPMDGVAPALIEWQMDMHPAGRLHEHGLSLAMLELFHPQPRRVLRMLASLGLDDARLVMRSSDDGLARLVAHIDTPDGRRIL